MPQTEKQTIGGAGEDAAARFLEERGNTILDRNYRRKWGEIDIVSEKDGVLHFVEVKASAMRSGGDSDYRPEENIRLWKKQRMSRAIRTYLLDKKIPDDKEFEIDVVSVLIDPSANFSKITYIQNVILN